ncbi:MAG: PKD domain-containing protein [Solirubrobacteraceae bacterium]|nr:PKD domain-containing protein [Solirubrobacteraceae bacterium]
MRAIRTTLLLAAALVVGLGAGPAAAAASGPGVIFYPKGAQPVTLPGALIAQGANVPQRTYSLPPSGGEPARKVALRGLSIRNLLSRSGVSPDSVTFVQVVNEYGGTLVLRSADFGSALISDSGGITRFFRASGGGEVLDYVEATAASGPLEISVEGGSDIPVKATASPTKVTVGKTVRFEASVRFSPPGSQFSYEWEFGDGQVASGARVTHAYDTSGPILAQVSVRNLDPDCATRCGGVQQVSVQVGEAPEQPDEPDPTPGGSAGDPQATGSASGTGGGGQGGSGGSGAGTGTTPGAASAADPEPKPEPKPPPPPPKPFGTTISGVLINDTGATAQTLPRGTPAGAPSGARPTRGGETGDPAELVLGGILALAAISLGALR